MANCLKEAFESIEGTRKISAEEKAKLKEASELLDAQVEALKNATTQEERKKLIASVKSLMEEQAENLANYKVTFLNDVIKTKKIDAMVDSVAMNADGTLDAKKATKALVDMLDGDNSVDTTQRNFSNKIKSMFKRSMIEGDIEKTLREGSLDRDVFVDMYDMYITKTKNKPTNELVGKAIGAFKKTNDFVHNMTVRSGAKIGYIDGYLLKQGNYDQSKLIDFGRDAFVEKMGKALNLEESFSASKLAAFEADPKELDRILGEIFDDMTKSKVSKLFGEDVQGKSYKSKLKSREFVFKDGESAWDVDQLFGREGKLIERFENQIESNATFIANTQVLGVNASKNLARVVDRLKSKMNSDDFNIMINKVNSAYVNTVAPPHSPTTTLGKTVNTARAMGAFSKLGSSVITASYDVLPSALQYAVHSGNGIIKSFGESVATFAKLAGNGITGGDVANQVSEMLGVIMHIDPLISMGLAPSQAKNFLGQKGNKLLSSFSTFTGVPLQTRYSRAVGAVLHAKNFASIVDGNVNAYQLENVIKRYGFTPEDMKILSAMQKTEIAGTKIINPSDIFEIDGINATHAQEIFTKYTNYIDDVVHKNTPTPTARTKRQMKKGYDQEQTTRELMNLAGQFKETAWKLLGDNAQAMQSIHTVGGKGAVAASGIELATVSAITYMAIEQARAVMFNRASPIEKLQDGEYKKTAMDFIAKSAIAPILADLVEGGFEGRPGQTAEYILGPSYNAMKDAGNIVKETVTGKPLKGSGRFIKKHILPSNWFPVKAAEGYLFKQDGMNGRRYMK